MIGITFADLYPFRSHWLDVGGARLHYVDEGPRDAPSVVMVHGNPTWSFYYRTLILGLRDACRVVAPDHIGCGLSDKPQVYPYTLAQHVRNLEQLLTHLNLHDVTLVMHDWGGAIGMGAAVRQPERVRSFVVLNTAAFYLPRVPLVLHLARSPVVGAFLVRGLNLFARGALIWGTAQPHRFTPDIRAGYLAPYDSWAARVAIYRFVQDIPVSRHHPTRRTLAEIDRRLGLFRHHPMLIVWGERDFVFTARHFIPAWLERFPRARVHRFADAGHYVVEDAHERILPLLRDFLGVA